MLQDEGRIGLDGMTRRWFLGAAGCTLAAGSVLGVGRRFSDKKGFCLVPRSTVDWTAKLTALNAKWFYTWGAGAPSGIPSSCDFVPMQWGKWGCSSEKMDAIKKDGHHTLLGFNEPDGKDQANLSVEKALELWPRLMDTGLRLGSPAGVQADGEWMTAFMDGVKARGYRVDFMTVHSYDGASADYFLDKLKRIYKLYDRPIWVTEFAVADWQAGQTGRNKFSQDQILKFMKDVLPEMERRNYIERYAWFSASLDHKELGTSALFNADGSLTKLGDFYASI
jgi:hypothetical protein